MKQIYLILNKLNKATEIYFLTEEEAKRFVKAKKGFTYVPKKCYTSLEEFNVEETIKNNEDKLRKKLTYLNNNAKYQIVIRGKQLSIEYKTIKSLLYKFRNGTKKAWIDNVQISISDYPKLLIAYNEGQRAIRALKSQIEKYENTQNFEFKQKNE